MTKEGGVDVSKDYFSREAHLCVTGQLEAECFAQGLGKVYTFGPTFRSENSNTPRHLAEFWMVEPEMAFCDLDDNRGLAVDYLKYLIDESFRCAPEEMDFLLSRAEAHHAEALQTVSTSEFVTMTYTEAIAILEKSKETFEFKPLWGHELQTEHERYLTEQVGGPLVVVDYPKDVKAFYMRLNNDGKTVRAMDVLVPGVGEIMGGSQREERPENLSARMDELGMDKTPLWWYLDLRKYGSVPHCGFGVGFERLLLYITGMKNIRDVIPFARVPRSCDF